MAITMISRPYDGKTYKILPVYNGLPFMVRSNYASTPNFKYIAEVFVGDILPGSKIGELRHNPDISGSNSGIFDVARILEDYILWTLPYNINVITGANTSALSYFVSFGEEYTRVLKPASFTSWALAPNSFKIFTKTMPTLTKSSSFPDAVYIEGSVNSNINGFFDAYSDTATDIIVSGHTYAPGTYGDLNNITIVQGEKFKATAMWVGADGGQYFILKVLSNGVTKKATTFNVGDKIFGKALASAIPQMENIEWTISKISSTATEYSLYTNIPYSSVPSNTEGWIVSKNNFVFRNIINTVNDKAIATNGVEQYNTYPSYQATPFIPNPQPINTTAITVNSKFLTKKPVRSQSLCLDDYWTLSAFGPRTYSTVTSTSASGWMMELWQRTNPFPTALVPTFVGTYTYGTPRIRLKFTGDKTSITNGSYVTVTGWRYQVVLGVFNWQAITLNTRVMNTYWAGGAAQTELILEAQMDPAWTYAMVSGTYDWSLLVTQKIVYYPFEVDANKVQTARKDVPYNRVEIPVGPKNLTGKVNFSDTSKYYVYPVYYTKSNPNATYQYLDAITIKTQWAFDIAPYKQIGERFEFILDCNCSKQKYTLTWLNELGGWDWFTFDARIDKSRIISKEQYDRKLNSNQTNSYGYKYGDRGRSTYNTNSRDSWTMISKYLTQGELDWLAYIYESPEVYIVEQSQSEYEATSTVKAIPVNITNTDVQLWNKANLGDRGTLYQYIITAEAANERIIQRGSNFGGYFYTRS
jgi:hypothetical protein